MIANNYMKIKLLFNKEKCNQYQNYFFDMQILKPIRVDMIQTIYQIHTDVVYGHKLLYKLQLALARDTNCSSLSL